MQIYLVEYKMMWAGRVIRDGVEQVSAWSDYEAQKKAEEYLRIINRKAEIQFGDVVAV